MPGIVGIISRELPSIAVREKLDVMVRSMMNETFYVSGTHSFP
jgi:hypothetical protein